MFDARAVLAIVLYFKEKVLKSHYKRQEKRPLSSVT